MGLVEIFVIGVGLSMDAFAVAVCKGLGMKRVNWAHAVVIAAFFGGFQALMPLLGWVLGTRFSQFITPIDHWIAFGLLAFIGAKMLWDAFHEDDECGECGEGGECDEDGEGGEGSRREEAAGDGAHSQVARQRLDMRELLMLAVATSIDALAVGITFAFLGVSIWGAILVIGLTTFVLSFIGVAVGNQFGSRFEKPATIVGGIVLILIGVKILLEHLGVLVL